MNYIKLFSIAILAMSLSLQSCKKETTPTTPPSTGFGTLAFDGTSYKIGGAFGEDYGQDSTWHDGYNIDLTMYSDGIVDQGDSLTGNGIAVYFEAITPTALMFEPGTYTYDDASFSPNFTFTDFSFIYVGDINNGGSNGAGFDLDPSSKFTVSKSGDVYTIVFDVTATSGEKLTGTFTGVIPIM